MTDGHATRGRLIGRVSELGRLTRSLGLDGRGGAGGAGGASGASGARCVLLGGDAGVGKTRVLAELTDRAAAAGWTVLVGHCVHLGDTALPYLPFREILARVGDADPGPVAGGRPDSPLARLTPGGSAAGSAAGSAGGSGGGVDRVALLEAVHGWLVAQGRHAPTLVAVEDVHWIDPSSRDLLGYLFAQPPAGVVVLASYRSDDLHRRHPLRSALSEWSRLPTVTRLPLGPLDDDEITTLAREATADQVPESTLRRIVERAAGNPFFAEELAAAARAGAGALPADLADTLLVRLDRVDDTARRVVRAAAVAGRTVEHSLLAAVVELDDATMETALRAAVEQNILVVADGPGYAFRHALLAEAISDDLLPGERVRLHAAYAAALARQPFAHPGTAAELARHARASGDLVTATLASVRAGDDAMSVAGWQEAAGHYETALELAATVGDDAAALDWVSLAERAGHAATAAGDPARAVALVREQLDRLPPATTPEQQARLLLALAAAVLVADTDVDPMQPTGRALHLLGERPGELRARALTLHARATMTRGRYDVAARAATEAVALGGHLGLVEVVADAKLVTARLRQHAGEPEASQHTIEDALAAARAGGEAMAEVRALYHLGTLHYEHGRLEQALPQFLAAARIAASLGRAWAPWGIDARMMAVVISYTAGDWDEAARLADTAGEAAPEAGWAVLTTAGLLVAAGRGDRSMLRSLPVLRGVWERDGIIAIQSAAAGIDLHAQAGDLAGAYALHDDAVSYLGQLWGRHFQARIRLAGLLLGAMGAAAPAASTRERPALLARAEELAEGVEQVWHAAAEGRRTPGIETIAWRTRVAAEHARLRWTLGVAAPEQAADLEARWRHGCDAFEALGHVFERARCQARLAAVLRAAGSASEAGALAEQAAVVARRLGAAPLLAELGVAAPSSRSRGDAFEQPLTEREREVLTLVAQGRSNREIGQRLFISTKTASVHVSHILAKLGAAARTEAASLARERGLLGGD